MNECGYCWRFNNTCRLWTIATWNACPKFIPTTYMDKKDWINNQEVMQ